MRAIARNIALVAIVAVAAAVLGVADTHSDVLELFASMTSALSDDNPAGFMKAFDRNMPDYDKLSGYVDGLIREAEVSASIDPTKDEGDDVKRSVDLDWTLQIRSRQMAGPLVERQKTVHVELVKQKKHWRIVSFTPLDLFAPAKFSLSK
jgi:hypothetical protein